MHAASALGKKKAHRDTAYKPTCQKVGQPVSAECKRCERIKDDFQPPRDKLCLQRYLQEGAFRRQWQLFYDSRDDTPTFTSHFKLWQTGVHLICVSKCILSMKKQEIH